MTLPISKEANIETHSSTLPFEMGMLEYLQHRYEVLSATISTGKSQLPEDGDLPKVTDKLKRFLHGQQLEGDQEELDMYSRLAEAVIMLQEKYIPVEEKENFSQLKAEEKLKGAIALESIMKQSLSSETISERFYEKSEPEKLIFLLKLGKREEFKQYVNGFNLAITEGNESIAREYGFESLDEVVEFQLQRHEALTEDQLFDLIKERKQRYIEEGIPDRIAETTAQKAITKAHVGLKIFDRLYRNTPKYKSMLRELGLVEEKKNLKDLRKVDDSVDSIKLLAA